MFAYYPCYITIVRVFNKHILKYIHLYFLVLNKTYIFVVTKKERPL